jgi:hypothetical protein
LIDRVTSAALTFDPHAQAGLDWVAALHACEFGADAAAVAARERLASRFGGFDDDYLEAISHLALAWIATRLDNLHSARREASQSVELLRRQAEPFWTAVGATSLGAIEIDLRERETVLRQVVEGRDASEQLRVGWLIVGQFAAFAVVEGRLEDARALLDEGLGLGLERVNTQGLSVLLTAIARLALAEGNPRESAIALGAADGLRRRARLHPYPILRRVESKLCRRSPAGRRS